MNPELGVPDKFSVSIIDYIDAAARREPTPTLHTRSYLYYNE